MENAFRETISFLEKAPLSNVRFRTEILFGFNGLFFQTILILQPRYFKYSIEYIRFLDKCSLKLFEFLSNYFVKVDPILLHAEV